MYTALTSVEKERWDMHVIHKPSKACSAFLWASPLDFYVSLAAIVTFNSFFFSQRRTRSFSTGYNSSFLEWQDDMMELAWQLERSLLCLKKWLALSRQKFRNNKTSIKWLLFRLLYEIANQKFTHVGLWINLLWLEFNAVQILSFNKEDSVYCSEKKTRL